LSRSSLLKLFSSFPPWSLHAENLSVIHAASPAGESFKP